MEELIIEGGHRLTARIPISGSKNISLAILAAALLFEEPVTLRNVPEIKDILFMLDLLRQLGAKVEESSESIVVDASTINTFNAPYEVVRKMRASSLILGPLLSRFGEAIISLPGGCAIGVRPINWHIDAMKALGGEIQLEKGYVHAKAPHGLKGAEINFVFPSVGATENAICAAVLAQGMTVISNAAKEPDIIALSEFLIAAGAKISGHGTSTIRIEGVTRLHSTDYTIPADAIEAFTYAMAVAATKGDAILTNVDKDVFIPFMPAMLQIGINLEEVNDGIKINCADQLKPCDIVTGPYPGFRTDCQAQVMALLTLVDGVSNITETIFESRFMHVAELIRLGADITIKSGNTGVIRGVKHLYGAQVMATDLRASASLVIAGLVANGTTTIKRVYHLDRGYDKIEEKLINCGAKIKRARSED